MIIYKPNLAKMKSSRKFALLCALLVVVFSFSGCSIRKLGHYTPPEKKAPVDLADTDSDGLPDEEEQSRGTDKRKADTDEDGLSDYDEVKKWGTDPLNRDTDWDTYPDGEEVEAGFDPLNLGKLDSDRDGLDNVEEKRLGTDPWRQDTDADGLTDQEEVKMSRDPLVKDR